MTRTTFRDRVDERMRLLQIYEVFLRYGTDEAFGRGITGELRRWMQSKLYGVDVELLSAPEKTRLMLQELGPTYVKLGQLISSRADALPPEWAHELEKLQSNVEPFPIDEANDLFVEEFGAPPSDLYESFDPKPLAAASLGQVHRATMKDGTPAVVKVQRPNVEGRIKSDLRILASTGRVAEQRIAWAREAGMRSVIEEFGGALLLELDYRLEAYNARKLAANLADLPGVQVPTIFPELSGRRILTMQYIEGVPANRREEMLAAGVDPTVVAQNAVRSAIKMVLIDGFFHADPHPGNVLVSLDTGVVTFIDTGMVGELDFKRRLNLVGLLYTMTQNDPLALAQSLRSLSEPFGKTDPRAFDQQFTRLIGPLMDRPEGEKMEVGQITSVSLDLLRDAGYRPDPQLSLAMKAITQSSEFMKVLYPPGHGSEFTDAAVEMVKELAIENLTEERVTEYAKRQAGYAVREAAQNIPSLSEAAGMWLRQYRSGRFEVKVDTSALEDQVKALGRISRQLGIALVLVGILVASAIAATAPVSGTLHSLQHVAIIGYAAALVVAVILLIALVRGSRKRDDEP